MKNFNMEVHRKIQFLGMERDHKKPIYKRELPKNGRLWQFAVLRGAWHKRGGVEDAHYENIWTTCRSLFGKFL